VPDVVSLASIPSPSSNGFHIGPFFFHAYGIMYVLAVAAAIVISRIQWEHHGGSRDLVYDVARWGFPAGLVGGRIYFCITTPSQIPDHWWGVFAIWDGGLGIWGGIAGGVAVGIWRLRRRLFWSETREFLNLCGPALPVAQAIGRVGNYFNQELYGKPTNLPWALRINHDYWPAGYHVPAQFIHGSYATFQPSFLYELIWDLLLAGFLIWLSRRRVVRAPGIFALYVAGYSGYRIFEETIRIDYSVYILGMRLNFWIALIGTLAGLAWFAYVQFGPGARRERAAAADASASAAPAAPTTVAR
jgi:prolipoprotein diacylglyceryl transferase